MNPFVTIIRIRSNCNFIPTSFQYIEPNLTQREIQVLLKQQPTTKFF